jgi:hypothetical protein
MSNFVKIRPVEAELFHADRQTNMTFRNFANTPNKIANGILRDIIRRVDQGVLHFQIISRLRDISLTVISFTPIKKLQLSLHKVSRDT